MLELEWILVLVPYVWVFLFLWYKRVLHKTFRKKLSPYIDAKVGYSVVNVEGGFCNPSVGCHFYFGHSNVGLSVGVGYVMQAFKRGYYGDEKMLEVFH